MIFFGFITCLDKKNLKEAQNYDQKAKKKFTKDKNIIMKQLCFLSKVSSNMNFFQHRPIFLYFSDFSDRDELINPKNYDEKLNKKLRQISRKFVQGNCLNYSMFYKIYFKKGSTTFNSKFNMKFHILITAVNNNNNNRPMKMDEPPSLSIYIYTKNLYDGAFCE